VKIPLQTKRDQYSIGKETQQQTERDGCIWNETCNTPYKRRVHMQSDVHEWHETYTNEKRRAINCKWDAVHVKRDVYMWKETYTCEKRRIHGPVIHGKRDEQWTVKEMLYIWNETCNTLWKRPCIIKETYQCDKRRGTHCKRDAAHAERDLYRWNETCNTLFKRQQTGKEMCRYEKRTVIHCKRDM